MKSNLLIQKIAKIQNDYRELLTSLLPAIQGTQCLNGIDEIILFWIRNMDAVRMFLNTICERDNSYVFTAITYLDYDEMEHIPFLLMGKQHIVDDPLSRYSELRMNMPEGKNAEFLYEQIRKTAENNLKILENIGDEILIFPLRLLNQSNQDAEFFLLGEQVFVNLFDGIDSIEDYFKKCCSIDDITRKIREDAERAIQFSENDDASLPLKQRFESAVSGTEYMVDSTKTDAYNFFIIVFGHIQQAIDIVLSCIEYNCIPFIRYPVALHYVSSILENIDDSDIIQKIKYKMSVAFVVYMLTDKEQLTKEPLDVLIQRNKEYDFERHLFDAIEQNGINERNFFEYRIAETVIGELEKFYKSLEHEPSIEIASQ